MAPTSIPIYGDVRTALPLDEKLYSLDPEETKFFKTLTGIEDDEQLKQHILAAQAKAYEVYPYPCIRLFMFTKFRITRLPAYPRVLELAKTRDNPILLDVGCGFGNDTRKAVMDGWPIDRTIAADLLQGYWDAGHQLFNSTPESFPVKFIHGDVFDRSFLEPREAFYAPPLLPSPDLQSVKSLTPLQGHISAIHTSQLFHLFDEAGQFELAKLLASLLSPLAGSVIFGAHLALPEKGYRKKSSPVESDHLMFCHSAESWAELWDGQVFTKGSVKVEAAIIELKTLHEPLIPQRVMYEILYSVTRL